MHTHASITSAVATTKSDPDLHSRPPQYCQMGRRGGGEAQLDYKALTAYTSKKDYGLTLHGELHGDSCSRA